MARIRHVLGLSGGRDSAALAVFMRQNYPDLDIEYFFTDTGKELPEVRPFLNQLEGFLGKPITYLNPDRQFDFWLKQYKYFLPSPNTRWCTRQLKLRPMESWLRHDLNAGVKIVSYIAIRADEDYREGYTSTHPNLSVKLPLREHNIDKDGVIQLLQASGVGLPDYYSWRSRSGCTFCFYQQKIEWVRLLEQHPEAFEEARQLEKSAVEHGSPFTWSQGESLEELAKPERIAQIREEHAKRVARINERRPLNPLRADGDAMEMDEVYGSAKMCLACHK